MRHPDYSKWVPCEDRPFFSVSRESMETVWEEMAESLQHVYSEARVAVGDGERSRWQALSWYDRVS